MKVGFARKLRRNPSDAERKLWGWLRDRRMGGFKFRRQVPLGPYVADFACFDAKLIIEIDGSQHLDQISYDEARAAYLKGCGYRVVRFWADDIFKNTDDVIRAIGQALGLGD